MIEQIAWDKPLCARCLRARESVPATMSATSPSLGTLYLCDKHGISYNRNRKTTVYAHTIQPTERTTP